MMAPGLMPGNPNIPPALNGFVANPTPYSTRGLNPSAGNGFGGGDTVLTNNITVNGAGQDADQIATLVALKIGEAVSDARSASLVV